MLGEAGRLAEGLLTAGLTDGCLVGWPQTSMTRSWLMLSCLHSAVVQVTPSASEGMQVTIRRARQTYRRGRFETCADAALAHQISIATVFIRSLP